MITFPCDECSRTLRADDSLSGKKIRCPACQQKTVIPRVASVDDATLPPAQPAEAATLPPSVSPLTETMPPQQASSAATLPPQDRPAQPPRDDRAPAGYVIEKELGRGGMGVVYKARSLALQRPCALKVILSGAHSGEAEVERFRTEAQSIARLQHPGIVQVFEVGEHDGRPFMALEFCGGGALDGKLSKNPLKPKEAAKLVRSLAEAMQAAHEAKVIHRDLKPANVLLTEKGEPKVTDFGLAKKLDEQGATRTGSVMGTPSYMPPEQAEGKKDIGPAADVYALGAILYECLASRPPFRAATPLDTILQVLTDEPVPVRQLNRQAPVDLETIAHKCLQKEPTKRYATAQELADDLGRYLEGEPIRARPVGAAERAAKWVRRNKVVSSLTAAVVLALLAGVVVSGLFAAIANEEAKAARKAEEAANEREKAEAAAKALAQKETQRAEEEKTRANEQLRRAEWLVYSGKLVQAGRAVEDGDRGLAVQLLDGCQWDLRGWEHRHLATRMESRQTLRGHSHVVNACAYTPDGRRIFTASTDKTLKVWDAETGQQVFSLKDAAEPVSLACDPSGKRIACGYWDGTVKVSDTQTWREALALKDHAAWVNGVAFSPDGKRLVTGSIDGTAKLWDAADGTPIRTLKGAQGAVAYSPDGSRILTAYFPENLAKVWDAQNGEEVLTLKGHAYGVSGVAYSPDGKRLLTGSYDGTARLWDARTGELRFIFEPEPRQVNVVRQVNCVAFSPDGKRLALGCADGKASLWDASTGQRLATFEGHYAKVTGVAFSPDGHRLLTGSQDHTVKTWDARPAPRVLAHGSLGYSVLCVAFSSDGKRILTGGTNYTVKEWDAASGLEVSALVHPGHVHCVAFSPDEKQILAWDALAVWRWQAGKRQGTRPGDGVQWGRCAALSGDRDRILYADWGTNGKSGAAMICDAQTGKKVVSLVGHTGPVHGVAFSPDGTRALTGSIDKTARVWDAATGRSELTLSGHTEVVSAVAFSHDGQRILTGSHDKTARVWDAKTGKELVVLEGHSSQIHCVAFSHDGQRILTGSHDKTARVWETGSGVEVLALKGHTMEVTSVAFSPDGSMAVTGSTDGTARMWDATSSRTTSFLKAPVSKLEAVAFDPAGHRLFAWGQTDQVFAWSATKGTRVAPLDPPARPGPGLVRSSDGNLEVAFQGPYIRVTHNRAVNPTLNHWPLPGREVRLRYHSDQAALAEKQQQHFAAAFHLGRLLLDDPDNADLKKRRDDALARHAVK